MAARFTQRQGEYLAFIHLYITLNKRPPAESDFQTHFDVSPSAVHQMIVALENKGLIQRTPGLARSIRLLVPAETLPGVEGNRQSVLVAPPFVERYPNIAYWLKNRGWIELGYEHNTRTCARQRAEGNASMSVRSTT